MWKGRKEEIMREKRNFPPFFLKLAKKKKKFPFLSRRRAVHVCL